MPRRITQKEIEEILGRIREYLETHPLSGRNATWVTQLIQEEEGGGPKAMLMTKDAEDELSIELVLKG